MLLQKKIIVLICLLRITLNYYYLKEFPNCKKLLYQIEIHIVLPSPAVSPNGSRSTTTTTETSCDSPANGHVEMPLIETNHNSEDDIPSTTLSDMAANSKHGQCQCKRIPYVDSHNVLQVLNSNMVCSYHNSLGQAISRYLAKVTDEKACPIICLHFCFFASSLFCFCYL